MRKSLLLLLLAAFSLSAGEKKLMHCFAFTAVEGASDADWQAFFKATDALPGKMPEVSRVWYGKLRNPLPQFVPDGETRKKLTNDNPKATGEVTRLVRQWGVCMEMNDAAALSSYAASQAHKDWLAAYSKVRVAGTTTYDIIGQ